MKFYRWYEQCGTYSTYNTHSCKIYIRYHTPHNY